MNRVVFTIIEKGTTVPCKQLNKLHDPHPHEIAYQSQPFPIYPITISIYLQNPPFNKFSICFEDKFSPCKATLFGSEDGNQFVKFHDLTDILQRQDQYIMIFKQKLFFSYIRLVLLEPPKSKVNVCNQLKLRGLQFTLISFMQTRYACSLKKRLSYNPVLFRLLELLEYKMLLLKQNKNRLYQKYQKRLEEVTNMIGLKSFNKLFPDQNVVKKFNQQIAYIQAEPISQQAFIKYPDPLKVKKDLYKLQKELKAFQVNRFSSIAHHISQYFHKYINIQIKESYLRQLSSSESQDHNKALTSFWAEVRNLQTFAKQTQEAIIMFFNFFLQFIEGTLKTTALKTLILFSKKNPNPFIQQLNKTYDRVLFNIFKYLHQTQDSELRELSLRYCYILYSRVTNKTFLQQLLNAYKDYTLEQQLQKMQILQKLTFRGVDIYNKDEIVHFLIDLLLSNKLNITEKNRAYNIAAYLASKFGKPVVMKDFQKLNSMLLMTMQKNIDNKLSKINHIEKKVEDQQSPSCQYCGIFSHSFKDQNLYDLHLAKECKFLTNCKYCLQNIEIPQLLKHYIEQCDQKLSFKHCDNCFEIIEMKEEEKHNQKCAHKLQTRCPLCYQKVDNKLRLKEHVLVSGCPNNPR